MQDILKYGQNKRSMLFKILFMGFVIVACSNVVHAEVGKWEVFETELTTTNTYNNPYLDVSLSATFTGPDGTEIIIDGFWDGGNNWKIRMAPTVVGTWSYTTSSSDSSLNGQKGNFDVVESEKKGFIIRDPNNDYAFKRSEGENMFWMGDTCWNSMSDRNGEFPFSTYKTYIDIRADQKFSYMRTYVVSLYAGSTNSAHYNEGGRAFDPWDPDNLNPNYFQEVDKRIGYANSKGITMNLVLGADRRLMTDFFGWDNGKMERYVRYIAARYSAYDIAWEGRAEFEEQGTVTPSAATLANQIGNWLEEYDPYGHIQSTHTSNSNNELGNQNWLDWIMHQSRDWDLIVSDRQYNKPVMNEEFYYEDSGAGSTHDHMVDADTLRKGAWKVMTHGASGLAYANTGTYSSRSQPFKGIEYSESKGADYMTYLYNFWIATDYLKLTPNDNIVIEGNAFAVENSGNEYVLYLPSGASTTVDLSAASGILSVEWYNPRTGKYQDQTTVEGGASRTFAAPDSNDWVLYIKVSPDTTPPSVKHVTATDSNSVEVLFLEAVEEDSACDISNYDIDNGVSISSASLGSDLKTVTLATTTHTEGDFTLTVNNVEDRASVPNKIAPNTQVTYQYVNELNNDSNNIPVITAFEPADNTVFLEGEDIIIDVTASDADGQALTYVIKINGATKSTSSSYTWETNYSSAGEHTIDIIVSDGTDQVTEQHIINITDVHPYYDVNEDGVVDILDLTIISQNCNTSVEAPYPRCDVNQDGIVDHQDLEIAGQHFSETVV